MGFQDKSVIVTGGSLGIGAAAAHQFAKRGAWVTVGCRNPGAAEPLRDHVTAAGGALHIVQCDVANEADVERLVDTAVDSFGRLDVLVNNAGVHRLGDAEGTSLADWDRVQAVNLTGAFLGIKYAVPHLEKTGGAVVNVSSEAGLVGIPNQVAYNVSKAGMIALTRSCAVDFAARGVRVNCVCPGTTATPLVDAALATAPDPQARRRELESCRPLDRLGTSDEIASAILYFASDEAAYATGAVLSVDGGYTAQ
ncbi:SDR family NAD(P)-dependent oxidoreductase [Bauldia sp.]|uniref:SDR family NAD(P)-dependent oxidoreductase n=1 Tax=Bauldia sp. TaxID=2575872 RepID=UPI003BA97CD4